ncbi:flagellar type III secretion system pore protein FliP [Qipengyuania sp. DGS5-3]|uniref:flagellar type III secretion system pore protein FliP n=1 Tax=Qipengyuania sp. DGS5-3 TaxID=3349632 RepID=UPI0036D3D059
MWGLALLIVAEPLFAAPVAPTAGLGDAVERAFGEASGANGSDGEPLALSLQVLLLMGLLSMLPALVLMMTSFTRILIVLSILRMALGLQQSPPNQVLVGLALFLSFFIMAPTMADVNTAAIVPYAEGTMEADAALEAAGAQFHDFMLRQTREANLTMFADIAGAGPFSSGQDIPMSIMLPAFVTSELQTAFQIGFMLFLPFLVIDLVVASILMSLGMMMLSPTIVSLPFKLLLFVLVDGWALLMGSLAMSFA